MPEKAQSNGERLQQWRDELKQRYLPHYGPANAKNEYLASVLPTAEHKHDQDDPDYGVSDIQVYPSPSRCEGCPICDFHFVSTFCQEIDSLVYSDSLNDADAKACILRLKDSVLDNQEYLRDKLKTHGDNLLKRWQKLDRKSLQARLKTSGIEEKAWPQVHRYYQHDWGWFEKRQHRSAFLTPCLNFETLFDSKPRFLRLLHNRTSLTAGAYFWDDVRALTFPLSTGLLSKTFNPNCLVTDGEQAGTLIPWDRERIHREEMCGFPVAKLVLESQELLLQQIRTIVDEVLAGLENGSGAEKWKQAAEDDFQSIGSHAGASEGQYPILEKPYGPPQGFHIIKLHDLVMLRHETLSDHLRDLQTDPPYMQSTVYEMTGAKEVLEKLDVSRKAEDHFWETSFRNVWLWDYLRLVDWGDFARVLIALYNVAAKGVPGFTEEPILQWDCGHDLPSAYADEISTLCRNIAAAWHDWILPLDKQCLQNFPGITKPHASRIEGDHFLEEDVRSYKARRRLWSKDRLVWALLELFDSTEVDPRMNVDVSTVLAVLAGEMSKPDQRARLDVKSCFLIEDLLAVHLIWLAAMGHRPAFPRLQGKFTLTMKNPDKMNAEKRTAAYLKQALIAVYHDKKRNPRDVGPELKAVYQARWPKGRSSVEWLKKATAARKELRSFWDRWRGIARLAINDLWPDAYTQNYTLVKVLKFDLQSEYGDGVKAEELAIRSQLESRPRKRKSADRPARLAEPQEYIPHSSTPVVKEKFEPPQKKQKRKTTGAPAPPPPAEPQEQSPPTTPVSPEKPKILVSKKSFEVLERMFPQESGNLKENTIRWREVEGVLAEAGLSIEQGQGSAVTFKQEADGDKRASRISIHRPHRQGDNVDAHILRRIGFRLKDRLGWRWKQFELKKR